MRTIREILRWKWELGRSHGEVSEGLGVSKAKVSATVNRAKALGLTLEDAGKLTDDELEARLYGRRKAGRSTRPLPDFAEVHTELKKKGVTLELLHLEYLRDHPTGYRYSRFCELYNLWAGKLAISMRQVHKAGEKTFVDYPGVRPWWVEPQTGLRVEGQLFVAALGASSYTFAEVTETQRVPDFIQSHVDAFEFFGGVTEILVPDQLRSAVTRPGRYEPGIQRTYEEMARHYGTVVIPARPRKPKDKATAEAAVQVAERWILARLRKKVAFSKQERNRHVRELLDELNDRPMRAYGKSRRELFELLDRPALKPLPPEPFVYAEWKFVTLNVDYHFEVDHHYYSAPYQLRGEQLEVRITAKTVEAFFRNERVASHVRSHRRGLHTTNPEHMPKSHRAHLEWSPNRLVSWGSSIGPKTKELVERILASRAHPEQGYRSCLGIFRLADQYGRERLEAACGRAVMAGARSYRHVSSILKNGLDRMPLLPPDEKGNGRARVEHENVRGGAYYRGEE